MLIFKMYNLERLVCQQMQNANPGNMIISILGNIDDKGKQLEEDYEYVKSAIAIPYNEMLEHINYYNGCCEMDEAYEITFIQDLSKKYNLEPNLVVKRFKWVDKLSKSLIYSKKLEEHYNSVEINIRKVRRKNNKGVRK